MHTIPRRTVAAGAAWAVPVIAVGMAVPAMAASGNCVPTFTVVEDESFKCCDDGPDKNLQVTFRVTDLTGCIEAEGGFVTILTVTLGNGKSPQEVNANVTVGDTFTVYFADVKSCPNFIDISYQTGGIGPVVVVSVAASNIPDGNTTGDCVA